MHHILFYKLPTWIYKLRLHQKHLNQSLMAVYTSDIAYISSAFSFCPEWYKTIIGFEFPWATRHRQLWFIEAAMISLKVKAVITLKAVIKITSHNQHYWYFYYMGFTTVCYYFWKVFKLMPSQSWYTYHSVSIGFVSVIWYESGIMLVSSMHSWVYPNVCI